MTTEAEHLHAAYVFRLYLAGGAPNSVRALANLYAICRKHFPESHRIEVVDGAGIFTFKVVSDRQISGGQADAVPVRGQAWLTLVTSSSPLVASNHVVVVAKATTTADQTGPALGARYLIILASLSGDPAAAVLALLWSLAFVAGLGVALYAIRRTRKVWLPYLFATPVLLACGLFACESLARVLPATL